jgi:hypothetical protein
MKESVTVDMDEEQSIAHHSLVSSGSFQFVMFAGIVGYGRTIMIDSRI